MWVLLLLFATVVSILHTLMLIRQVDKAQAEVDLLREALWTRVR